PKRPDDLVERPSRLPKAPPVLLPHLALVLVPLRLYLLLHDRDQVRPALGLFERHLSKADHVSSEILGRARVDLGPTEIWEDSLGVLRVPVDQRPTLFGRQREAHSQHDRPLEA